MTTITTHKGCAKSNTVVADTPLFDALDRDKPFEICLYDKNNPEIWNEFERIALGLRYCGREHSSAKAIFEIIRHNTNVRAKDDAVKIDNNYTAYYARRFIHEHPDHEGFFELRERA